VTIALGLTACSPPSIAEYEPVIDQFSTDMSSYDNDIVQCRSVASAAKVEYDQAASKAVLTNVLVGAVAGAVVGSAVGSGSGDLTRYGAASGMAAGAASTTDLQLIAKYGPNKIIDRCMANRGYPILNDIGAGTN
jgi:outer membrane lipoprotein SlyB